MRQAGTLPVAVGALSELHRLLLSGNGRLGGPLPSELMTLRSLQCLHLCDNSFVGQM
jgi:hypothetical protein